MKTMMPGPPDPTHPDEVNMVPVPDDYITTFQSEVGAPPVHAYPPSGSRLTRAARNTRNSYVVKL